MSKIHLIILTMSLLPLSSFADPAQCWQQVDQVLENPPAKLYAARSTMVAEDFKHFCNEAAFEALAWQDQLDYVLYYDGNNLEIKREGQIIIDSDLFAKALDFQPRTQFEIKEDLKMDDYYMSSETRKRVDKEIEKAERELDEFFQENTPLRNRFLYFARKYNIATIIHSYSGQIFKGGTIGLTTLSNGSKVSVRNQLQNIMEFLNVQRALRELWGVPVHWDGDHFLHAHFDKIVALANGEYPEIHQKVEEFKTQAGNQLSHIKLVGWQMSTTKLRRNKKTKKFTGYLQMQEEL